jgi:hypothetical protein
MRSISSGAAAPAGTIEESLANALARARAQGDVSSSV